MIKPTVGRVVWYWPLGKAQKDAGEQPRAAQIAHVHADSVVNIGFLDQDGVSRNATSVLLMQEGDDVSNLASFCEWMPYQQGQAAKTEAAEIAEVAAAARALGHSSY